MSDNSFSRGLAVTLFAMILSGTGGAEAETLSSVQARTRDWYPHDPVSLQERRGSALDMSRFLDAPAGKHGRVLRQGETLVFSDTGQRVRFWGTNLVGPANFPDKQVAGDYAEGIAQLGYNMVRLHHLDAFWSDPNLFGSRFPAETRKLCPEALDRFDYLVSQLRARGIYLYLDLLVHRKVTALDGVPEDLLADLDPGMKVEGLFVPQLIELQKEFIEQLLTHRNPYTGLRYVEDPAIVFHGINNENSLFKIRPRDEGDLPVSKAIASPTYRALWKQLFNDWLTETYATREDLSEAWKEEGKMGLLDGEDPAQGTVEPAYHTFRWWRTDYADSWSPARQRSFWRFVFETQQEYYRDMRRFVASLGSQALVAGGNRWFGDVAADLLVDAESDFFDVHSYWAHPAGGFKYAAGTRVSLEDPLQPALRSTIGDVSAKHVSGLPLVISEWNISAPHPHKSVLVPLLAAFASLKGWNPLHFAYSHTREPQTMVEHVLDAYNHPDMQALLPVAALLFHSGAIPEAQDTPGIVYAMEEVFDPSLKLKRATWDSLRGKATVRFSEEEPPAKIRPPRHTTTPGGEITWTPSERFVRIRTENIEGILGALTAASDGTFRLETAYGSVLIASLTDEPIATSSSVLITAVAESRPTDMLLAPITHYGNEGVRIVNPGTLPLLIEPVRGTVHLVTQRNLTAAVLNVSGQVLLEHPIHKTETGYSIPLSADTMHYLLTAEGGP